MPSINRMTDSRLMLSWLGLVERGCSDEMGALCHIELGFGADPVEPELGIMYCPNDRCQGNCDANWLAFEGQLGAVVGDVVEFCKSSGLPAVVVRVKLCGLAQQQLTDKLMRINLRALVRGLTLFI